MNADEITRGQRVLLAGAPELGVYIVTPWRDNPVVDDTGVSDTATVRLVREDSDTPTGPAVWRTPGELTEAPPARPVGDEWVGKRVTYQAGEIGTLSSIVLASVSFTSGSSSTCSAASTATTWKRCTLPTPTTASSSQ